MAGLPETLLETAIISVGRTSLFFACRHYLLGSLYHDLRRLSSSTQSMSLSPTPSHETVPHSSDTELEDLPPPATTPRTPGFTHSQNQRLERNWHSTLSRATFSLCFSESCTLFLIVLSQAVNLFSPRARYLNWRISLGLLVSTILLAAPLQQCLFLTHRTSSKAQNRSLSSHLILTGIPYCIYLLVLSYIPLPSRLKSPGIFPLFCVLKACISHTVGRFWHPELTTATLSRLVVLGTIILGLLAGFGAASAVFTHVQLTTNRLVIDHLEARDLSNTFESIFFMLRESVSDAQIIAAEQALFRVRSDLLERQQQVERGSTAEPPIQGGFFSRLTLFSGNNEITSLRREIIGLEALEYQMARNVKYLRGRRTATLYSETLRGRVWTWVGKLFALYCAVRVVNSVINLCYPLSQQTATSTPDLLASLLARVVSVFLPVSDVNIAAASRQFSLLLIGAIILSSVRRALRGVARILKVTSKNLAASLLLLILAQLMGTYLLSTLIQLRTSFPSPADSDENLNLFATLPEYHVFGPLWDGAFLISVAVSGAARWFDERINGPGL